MAFDLRGRGWYLSIVWPQGYLPARYELRGCCHSWARAHNDILHIGPCSPWPLTPGVEVVKRHNFRVGAICQSSLSTIDAAVHEICVIQEVLERRRRRRRKRGNTICLHVSHVDITRRHAGASGSTSMSTCDICRSMWRLGWLNARSKSWCDWLKHNKVGLITYCFTPSGCIAMLYGIGLNHPLLYIIIDMCVKQNCYVAMHNGIGLLSTTYISKCCIAISQCIMGFWKSLNISFHFIGVTSSSYIAMHYGIGLKHPLLYLICV